MNHTKSGIEESKYQFTAEAFQRSTLPVITEVRDQKRRNILLEVCARPEFVPLIRSILFKEVTDMKTPFRVPSADQIDIHPEILLNHSVAAVFLRHALEVAIWQSKMEGYASLPAFLGIAVLSANAVRAYWKTIVENERQIVMSSIPSKFRRMLLLIINRDWLNCLSDEEKSGHQVLLKQLLRLQDMDNVCDSALTTSVLSEAYWLVKRGLIVAAPSEYLLTQGGDDRLRIDKTSGLNGYGCSPKPRPWAVTFASTTASSISDRAFHEVEFVRQRLVKAVCHDRVDEQYTSEVEQVRSNILKVFQLEDISDASVFLTTSGTDAELVALYLVSVKSELPVMNILVGPEETGGGTPLAAAGRHFSTITPLGNMVEKGAGVEGLPLGNLRVVEVPVRDNKGANLSAATIDSRMKTLVSKAIADGSRVLVHMVDSSKTGLVTPSFEVIRDLKSRYGFLVDVLVDACQMRTGNKRLREYLQSGFMVALTGSKFYTGPPFSGALVIPKIHDVAHSPKSDLAIPIGLYDYLTTYELPEEWRKAPLPSDQRKNIGLMLRWKAALWEMGAFQVVSDKHKYLIFSLFGESIREMLSESSFLELVQTPSSERWEVPNSAEWDWLPTIFTFTMSRPGPHGLSIPIYYEEAKKIYHWLNMNMKKFFPAEAPETEKQLAARLFHIGQPVKISLHEDRWIGGLRISAGARLVSGICFDPELGRHFAERLSREIGDACSALDKITSIIKYFDYIDHHYKEESLWRKSDPPYVL